MYFMMVEDSTIETLGQQGLVVYALCIACHGTSIVPNIVQVNA